MKSRALVFATLTILGLAACQTAPSQPPQTETNSPSGLSVEVQQLPELRVASFSGFAPEPESQAGTKMMAWLEAHPEYALDKRIFGHNITPAGDQENSSQASGYKFMVTLPPLVQPADTLVETIAAGTFAVTTVQGSFAADPEWLGAAWGTFNTAIEQKKLTVKVGARWYEEELDSPAEGITLMKLYLELD